MKKLSICLIMLLTFSGCSSENSDMQKLQNKIEKNGYKIHKSDKFDGMQVLEISNEEATFMMTAIDEKIQFISYHNEDVNTYITYLKQKNIYLGEVYADENNYCSYHFNDKIASDQCDDIKLDAIHTLKKQMNNDLNHSEITIEKLYEWASWKLSNH